MQLLANTTSPFVRIARVALIEKGLHIEPTVVDPWADDVRLRQANAATRVPSLILDDGTPLTESLLIVQWLEATYPAPKWPSLLGSPEKAAGVLSRAGVAVGATDGVGTGAGGNTGELPVPKMGLKPGCAFCCSPIICW